MVSMKGLKPEMKLHLGIMGFSQKVWSDQTLNSYHILIWGEDEDIIPFIKEFRCECFTAETDYCGKKGLAIFGITEKDAWELFDGGYLVVEHFKRAETLLASYHQVEKGEESSFMLPGGSIKKVESAHFGKMSEIDHDFTSYMKYVIAEVPEWHALLHYDSATNSCVA